MRSGLENSLNKRKSWGTARNRHFFTASLDIGTTESRAFHLQSVHSSHWAVNQSLHIYFHKMFRFMVSPKCLQSLPMYNFSALKDEDHLEVKPIHSVQQLCSHKLSEKESFNPFIIKQLNLKCSSILENNSVWVQNSLITKRMLYIRSVVFMPLFI